MSNQEENNKSRVLIKGIRYPMFDLDDGAHIVSLVSKLGGGTIDIEVLAQGLGNSTSTTRQHISSAKYFNLINRKNNIISNTDLANQICMPISNEEKIQNLQKAFFNFSIFSTLYERFKGNSVPDESILSNLLHREFGISVTGKSVLARNFISSLKSSKLGEELPEGELVIPFKESKSMDSIEEEPIEEELMGEGPIEETSIEVTPDATSQNISGIEINEMVSEIIDFEYELETYKSKGLFLQVDPNNNLAIKKGINFFQMLLQKEED